MKRLLILLLFISLNQFSSGQDVGFHIGVNFSNQKQKGIPENLPDYKGGGGIRVGFDLTERISKNLSFMMAVSYSQKGANKDWDFRETGFIYKIKNTLNYVEVPVSLLIINPDIKTTPYFSFGVYAAFLVSGQIAPPSRSKATELFKKNDAGIRVSTGIKFNQVWVDVTYDIGLSNINSRGEEFKVKNRNLGLVLRYFPKF